METLNCVPFFVGEGDECLGFAEISREQSIQREVMTN